MQGSIEEETQSLASKKQLQRPQEMETNLMKQVVSEEVNPATVKAACQCAGEIHKMLKLNLELKKSGL